MANMVDGGRWGLTGVRTSNSGDSAEVIFVVRATYGTQEQLKRAAATTCPHHELL
jgi:hypothetical protein